MNILFVCSRNQWRSPTAERVWRTAQGVSVRSAGTSASARRRVGLADIAWADIVFVMEDEHKSRLRKMFGHEIGAKEIVVLDIPDEFPFMDKELVALITSRSAPYILHQQDS
jgi:predicted protein tyrosine phosphatase